MHAGPPRALEAIVGLLVPPACREEVVGDLHERYRSPSQYAVDALCAVPLIIISRIRRTTDPQVLLMQAFVLSVSFFGAAWFQDPALLEEQWGLLRLAIPAGVALIGLMLEDAYASPGMRSPLSLVRGPMIGLALTFLSQGVFLAGKSDLVVSRWTLFCGSAMGLLLSSALRMLFPPPTSQLQGANVPALWLKRAGEPAGSARGAVRIFKGAAGVAAVALLAMLLVAYRLWKQGG